jgi:hypothetical protein
VAFLRRAAPTTVKRSVHPLFEFRRPPESCPTQPSLPAAASKLLSWAFAPYSARRPGSPLAAGDASTRYVPPAGFDYPLGGLLLPSPCRFYFAPAALLGFALRSFLLPEGIRRVSAGMNPRTVSPVGNPAAGAVGRPNGPRFLGFDPSGSPWRRAGVNSPTAGCSLGLHPPGAIQQEPCPGFRPDSSHALRKPARRPAAGAPEYRSAPA